MKLYEQRHEMESVFEGQRRESALPKKNRFRLIYSIYIYLLVALYISLSELKFFHNYQFIFIDNY